MAPQRHVSELAVVSSDSERTEVGSTSLTDPLPASQRTGYSVRPSMPQRTGTHPTLKMSKPVLYTFPISVWAAQLVAADLPVDVDDTAINLLEGGNFNPEFVQFNPNATVPTLTHDRKSFTSTVEVINYLVSISQKKITPEPPSRAWCTKQGSIQNFTLGAARNDEELAAVSNSFVTTFTKSPAIDRGPFIAGAESEVDDFHVAAWLMRIAYVVGAQKSDDGVSALEKRFRPIPHKIEVFWTRKTSTVAG
ncbi:hypothetical protein BC827DRAFT_1270781 [Russula dissimulans]|nr:hypothetical protein BC827DRAFT_1270781 [Russula dissimulans]